MQSEGAIRELGIHGDPGYCGLRREEYPCCDGRGLGLRRLHRGGRWATEVAMKVHDGPYCLTHHKVQGKLVNRA